MLRFAYCANIIILLPVVLPLWRHVFSFHMQDAANFSYQDFGIGPSWALVAALWTGILLASAVGLLLPKPLIGILVLQVIYKALWLCFFAAPLIIAGRYSDVPWGMAGIFFTIIILWPIILWAEIS